MNRKLNRKLACKLATFPYYFLSNTESRLFHVLHRAGLFFFTMFVNVCQLTKTMSYYFQKRHYIF